jgi:hypothetical protein
MIIKAPPGLFVAWATCGASSAGAATTNASCLDDDFLIMAGIIALARERSILAW